MRSSSRAIPISGRSSSTTRASSATTGVEEFIRWVTPILNMRRTATEDHELHGQSVRAGDELLLMYSSANRDERVFDDPDTLDVTRQHNHHVAFGFGTHFCLGASLARLELRVMFEELLRRMPDMELVPGATPRRLPSAFAVAYDSIPMQFTARRSYRKSSSIRLMLRLRQNKVPGFSGRNRTNSPSRTCIITPHGLTTRLPMSMWPYIPSALEVVVFAERVEERGAGQPVHPVAVDDVVDGVAEQHTGAPRRGTEPGHLVLAGVANERGEHLVRPGLVEGEEGQRDEVPFDVGAALLQERPLVAAHRAAPHLHRGHPLQLRLLPERRCSTRSSAGR